MFILLIFYGYNKYWAVAIFTVALTLNGAVTAGYLGNGLDIAPNFSGTIFGMANTGSSIGGFVSAWMVGEITFNNVSSNKTCAHTESGNNFSFFAEHLRSVANHFRNRGCVIFGRKFVIPVLRQGRNSAMEQPAREKRRPDAGHATRRRRSTQDQQCILNSVK